MAAGAVQGVIGVFGDIVSTCQNIVSSIISAFNNAGNETY